MEFTQRGLIKKGKNTYCKSWDDLYQLEQRNTENKRKKFRSKYKDLIVEFTYEIKGRTQTYLIASKELANNKILSDLQKVAFKIEDVKDIKSNRAIRNEYVPKTVLKQVYAILIEMVNYQWDETIQIVNGCVLNVFTGEIVADDNHIIISIKEFYKNGAEVEEIAFSILVDLKCRIDKFTFINLRVDVDENIRFFKSEIGTQQK
ncbi:MAG: hypothetical protein ACRC7S_10205 [Cetobacterium sp.]